MLKATVSKIKDLGVADLVSLAEVRRTLFSQFAFATIEILIFVVVK
jgi:hypothetical protein